MTTHINLGLVYRWPYESKYSMIRRIVCANSGKPWQACSPLLRSYLSSQSLAASTRRYPTHAGNIKSQPKTKVILRQCPDCASGVYHNDLYRYPWLSRCPLHRKKLVTKCPECKLPWPSADRIHQRQCRLCGWEYYENIDHSNMASVNNFSNIEKIHKILSNPTSTVELLHHFTSTPTSRHTSVWTGSGIHSSEYPSLLAALHDPTASKDFKKLGIMYFATKCKSTPLSFIDNVITTSHKREFESIEAHNIHPECMQMIELEVAKKILSEIQKTIGLSNFTISDCRRRSQHHLRSNPLVCAFNAWFFYITRIKYETYNICFSDAMSYNGLPAYTWTNEAPLIRIIKHISNGKIRYYRVNDDGFCHWSYLRTLELAFASILNYLVRTFIVQNATWTLFGHRSLGAYLARITNGKLTVSCLHENIIEQSFDTLESIDACHGAAEPELNYRISRYPSFAYRRRIYMNNFSANTLKCIQDEIADYCGLISPITPRRKPEW